MGTRLTYVDREANHVVVRLLNRVMLLVQMLQHLDLTQDAFLSDLTSCQIGWLVTLFRHFFDSY